MTFPVNWQTRRARFSFSRRDVRGADAPLASATKDGVTLRSDLGFSVWNPDSNVSNYKLVEPDDFVIGLRSFQHGISHSAVRGIVSPAYTVLRSVGDLDPRFFKHYFRSSLLISHLANITQGIRQGQAIDIEAFQNLPMPVPPLEEQRRIADFLDVETACIDNLSGLGERQINLLRERSEAMVVQFFGPGDGRREYRFRHLMESNPCYGVLVPKFADDGVPLIRVSDLGKLDHDLERLPRIEEEQAQEYKRTCISPGDLLVTVVGATIGRCDVAPPETAGFNVSRALARIQLAAGIAPQMIASWVRGRDFRIQAELATSGAAAQPALNMSDITHFTVWLPETHSGRQDLARRVSTLEDETRRLLSAIERKQALIAARRQALITAAVTGQFDVSTAGGRNLTDGVSA